MAVAVVAVVGAAAVGVGIVGVVLLLLPTPEWFRCDGHVHQAATVPHSMAQPLTFASYKLSNVSRKAPTKIIHFICVIDALHRLAHGLHPVSL